MPATVVHGSARRRCLWLVLFSMIAIPFVRADDLYPVSRRVRYSFTLQNPSDQLISPCVFTAYVPVKQTSMQQCRDITVSHPVETVVDTYGNQAAKISFADLPPYAVRIVTIEAELGLAPAPVKVDVNESQWLGAGPRTGFDTERFEALAPRRPPDGPVRDRAESIYRWVRHHVHDTGYVRRARGALYALERGEGDCTEMMDLFVALCRRAGIPARGIGGYVYAKDAVLSPAAFHNWAEFYADGRWQIADPSRGMFQPGTPEYLATNIMGPEPSLLGIFPRFAYEPKTLKVRMNP